MQAPTTTWTGEDVMPITRVDCALLGFAAGAGLALLLVLLVVFMAGAM